MQDKIILRLKTYSEVELCVVAEAYKTNILQN